MYLKLAFRSAKRSLLDYLLYLFTLTILVSVMCLSHCAAVLGERQAGFQTASLPLLIASITVVLVDYINIFILKQRAKELATYLLLGMEKRKLSLLFVLELCGMGILCLFAGLLLGIGGYSLLFQSKLRFLESEVVLAGIASGVLQTFACFGVIEILSALRLKQKIRKLTIGRLMSEKRRNQPLKAAEKKRWGLLFFAAFCCFFILLWATAVLSDAVASVTLPLLSIPMLLCIFAFYKWLYSLFSARRRAQPPALYQGDRLYRLAEITAGAQTGAAINAVFCGCLLFSALSFVFGRFMLRQDICIFPSASQQWMGFLQISICVVFMVIYFSILSLLQIIELKRQTNNVRILHCIGKSVQELNALLRTQILVKLFIPTLMCVILLAVAAPLTNYKLNAVLPAAAHNALLTALGEFTACFAVLYLCYFLIVYAMSRASVKNIAKF